MIVYKQVPSPNFGYPRGTHGQNNPRALVWHITASRPTTPPLAGLDSWFVNPDAGSTQLGIQDLEVHQYVQFEDACWGAGYLANPDLSNSHVYRWWNESINPNLESFQVEVVSLPGVGDVRRGMHRLSRETWETMQMVGLDIVERCPTIELVAFDWIGHYQIDGVNRIRDPKTVYWPVDILNDIKAAMPPEEEEEDMKPYLAWDIDKGRAVLIGPFGVAWVTEASDVEKLKAQYGEMTEAYWHSTIEAIRKAVIALGTEG